MKILFVTPDMPSPYGGGQRTYYMIKHLAKLGIEIHLLSLAGGNFFMEELRGWCSKITRMKTAEGLPSRLKNLSLLRAYSFDPELKNEVAALDLSQYDLAHVHKFQMAEYFRSITRIPVLIDLWACGLGGAVAEAVHETHLLKKLIVLSRIPRYYLADRKYYASFHNFFVVSAEARDFILRRYSGKKVYVVPQGIEWEKFALVREEEKKDNHNLIFTGDMSFFQNIDTAKHLAQRIFPLIKDRVKSARLHIVGKDPTKDIRRLARKDPSIVVTGFVKDMSESLGQASVFVAPIRTGIGMRTKIVEAMAWGLPVVTTRLALEGIEGEDGKDFIVAEKPVEFAARVVDLLNDPPRRTAMARNARRLVREKYSWEGISPDIIRFYREISRDRECR